MSETHDTDDRDERIEHLETEDERVRSENDRLRDRLAAVEQELRIDAAASRKVADD